VECKSNNGPELPAGHSDEYCQRCDQQFGTCRAKSQRQAMWAIFGPIDPEALIDVGSRVQGQRHCIPTGPGLNDEIGGLTR
jgi:hypothetical protein